MKRTILSMMLAALALPVAAGCPGNDDDNASGESRPFRGDWITVIDQPFDIFNEDGTINISSITIGDDGGDNFNNRGDIIVRYHDNPRIIVEMRKFTMVENQQLADEDFDKLSIWASTATLPPPPYPLDEEDNCADPENQLPWQNGCQIAVFYDGQSQVERSGADLRVTLPRDYIYELELLTSDNDVDSDYQNRGNVCVEGLPGSVDIELSNGTAWVILDESMSEMPECVTDQRRTCEESGWDPQCPCIVNDQSFSQVSVNSRGGQAADVVVDIPAGDFWVSYNMRNDGNNTPGDDNPGGLCEAVVDPSAGNVVLDESIDLVQSPNTNQGSINYPGEPAVLGAGYSIQVNSDQCSVILATENPDDFVGAGNGPTQEPAERGNLTVCAGCARTVGCESLIPGG